MTALKRSSRQAIRATPTGGGLTVIDGGKK